MKEIFSLVKVTYDYFRCEDLLYIGTEEEIEKIILEQQEKIPVKKYGLKDKIYKESDDAEEHYWIYNRSLDGIKVKVKSYEELIKLSDFGVKKESNGTFDYLVFLEDNRALPIFLLDKEITVIKLYNEDKIYFDYEDLQSGYFLKKEWIKQV